MINKLSLIITLLFLCSCQTPYQKQTWYSYRGGHSNAQTDDDKFVIVFNGNGHTPLEKVKDYALLRSAEVTTENNFEYFKIDSGDAKYVSRTTYSCYNGVCTPIVSSAPTATYNISCYNKKPKTKDLIYNAKATAEELRQKYSIR